MRPKPHALSRTSCTVLLALTAACGSTVQTSSTTSLGGGAGDGLSPASGTSPTTSGSGGSGLPSGGSSGIGQVGTDGTSSSRTTVPLGDPSGGNSAPAALGATPYGLGVTSTTITVGATYLTNGDAANSALGASGVTTGDGRANLEALRDEINAHGGIAGRRLVLVLHPYDAQSTLPGTTQDAAACADFTQDHHVIAVFPLSLSDVLPDCLKKAGVVQLRAGALVGEDKAYFNQYPNAFLLDTMIQDRILKDVVTSFQRQKYFGAWNNLTGQPGVAPVKVAVLTYDEPSFRRAVAGTLLPQLRAAGHTVDSGDVFYVHRPQSESDVSGTVSGIKSATLRMQQDGITHLVFNDATGLILGLFSTNAQTQAYFPRFGITSGAAPQASYTAGLVKANQLNGMSGNGWLPTIDLPAADGTRYGTSATQRCLDIMKRRTGQTYTSTNAASIALIACDSLFLVQQALAKAPSLSPAGLIAGIESLGGSFVSALLPASFLSSQHDNAIQAFDQNWVASCNCVRYSSPRDVPTS